MAVITFGETVCRDTDTMLRVRICRLMDWKKLEQDEPDGFQFVLVDGENRGIHAVMNNQGNATKFCLGFQYKITDYFKLRNAVEYVIVPGPFVLMFDEDTKFQYVPEVHPTLPLYWFNFQQFSVLNTKLGDKTMTSDVIGRVVGINPTFEVRGCTRIRSCCNVRIQNERGEIMTVRLRKHAMDSFNAAIEINSFPPTVAAFTSILVREIDGQIVLLCTQCTCVFVNPCIEETHRLRSSLQDHPQIVQTHVPTVQPLDVQLSHVTFTTRAKIDVMGFMHSWYERSNQGGVPMYNIRLNLMDTTGRVPANLKGKAADKFFGVCCQELVEVRRGYHAKKFPELLLTPLGSWYVWELLFRPGQVAEVLSGRSNQDLIEEGIQESQPLKTISEINQAVAALTTTTECSRKRQRSPNSDQAGPSRPTQASSEEDSD